MQHTIIRCNLIFCWEKNSVLPIRQYLSQYLLTRFPDGPKGTCYRSRSAMLMSAVSGCPQLFTHGTANTGVTGSTFGSRVTLHCAPAGTPLERDGSVRGHTPDHGAPRQSRELIYQANSTNRSKMVAMWCVLSCDDPKLEVI